MSILQKWGLGAELFFNTGNAVREMARASSHVGKLREGFATLSQVGAGLAMNLAKVGMGMAPLGAGFTALLGKGSAMAADLEATMLTMRVLIGDADKAAGLVQRIRDYAATTPFEEGDLLEGSKRLLRLTGQNVDRNMDLLKVLGQLVAMNPTKNMTEAVEALLDATAGGGFERFKEFGVSFKASMFSEAGEAGSAGWADAIVAALEKDVAKKTRGEDLVEALGKTFKGRMSTLLDTGRNMIRDIGMVENERIGGLIVPFTDWLGKQAPVVKAAFTRFLTSVADLAEKYLVPVIDRFRSWWDGLGDDGRAKILQAVFAVAGLAAGLTAVGTVAGVLLLVVGGLVGALAALAPLFSEAGLVAVAGLAAGVLQATAALGVLWALIRRDGEGPLDTLRRVGLAVKNGVVGGFRWAVGAVRAFWYGFQDSAAPAQATFAGLIEQVQGIVAKFLEVGGAIRKSFDLNYVRAFGQVVGFIARVLGTVIVHALKLIIGFVDVLVTGLQPVWLAVWKIMDGFLGWVSGTKTFGQAFGQIIEGIGGLVVAMIGNVLNLALGLLEEVMRGIAMVVSGIPGADRLLGATGDLGADRLAEIRHGFEDEVAKAITGVDQAARDRAGAATPEVNVAAPQVTVEAPVTTKVEVDGEEVAKSQGRAAARKGEKGHGPKMPAEQRGRVLRGGLQVTALNPAEVL